MTLDLQIRKKQASMSEESDFFEAINSLAREISAREEKKAWLTKELNFLKFLDLNFLGALVHSELNEIQLVHEVHPTNLVGLSVAGVDGGLISKSFHNFDLLLTRAVACIFHYQKDRPVVQYITSESPRPFLRYNLKPLTRSESDLFANLERIACEIELARSIFDQCSPEIILLDGSILPVPADRPNASIEPRLYRKYCSIMKNFEELYETCITNNTILAGCIKDTRSIRFIKFLGKLIPHLFNHQKSLDVDLSSLLRLDYRDVMDYLRDTEFLYSFLEVGERTAIMNFFENKSGIINDLSEKFRTRLKLFYLKTVPHDLPMRVEFLALNGNPIKTARKLSAVLFPISSYHSKFGVPTVLIEADARARLSEYDLEFVYDILHDSVPGSLKLMKLRRERRPF
ncbi:MAG: DNA double-strand break repair nuclease NurA [Candidatus Helarchaeales archaeon]